MKPYLSKFKKVLFILISFFISTIFSFSQIVATRYCVDYICKFKNNNNEWSKPEKFILIGTDAGSYYLNYNDFRNDSLVYHNLGEWDNNAPKEVRQDYINKAMKLRSYNVRQDLNIWKDQKTGTIACSRSEGYFLVSKERLRLDWVITDEKLEIKGMMCTKATTKYGGRTYVAYFNPDIPINDGPYKFNNLPGLIIKVTDDEEKFDFELVRIRESITQYINKKRLIPNQNAYITREEMIIVLKRMIENPQNYMLMKFDEESTARYIESMKNRMDLLIEKE